MRSQSGYTVIELVVVLAIISLIASMALLSGSAMMRSARVSSTFSKLVDDIAVARMRAISQSALWKIKFDQPSPGDSVVQEYSLQSCSPTPCSGWDLEATVQLEEGMGIQVPLTGSGEPKELQFNKNGFFAGSTMTLKVCRIQTNGVGNKVCQYSGSRTLTVHGHTGVLEY